MSSSGDQVVRRPDFSDRPIQNLEHAKYQCLFNRPVLDDIVLNVSGEKILAHKQVLFDSSSYFRAMLCPGFKEGQQSVIELHGDGPQIFKEILRWMYGFPLKFKGQIFCATECDYLLSLAICADKYELSELYDNLLKRLHYQMLHGPADEAASVVVDVQSGVRLCPSAITTITNCTIHRRCLEFLHSEMWCTAICHNISLTAALFMHHPELAKHNHPALGKAFDFLVNSKDAAFILGLLCLRAHQINDPGHALSKVLCDPPTRAVIQESKMLMSMLLRGS